MEFYFLWFDYTMHAAITFSLKELCCKNSLRGSNILFEVKKNVFKFSWLLSRPVSTGCYKRVPIETFSVLFFFKCKKGLPVLLGRTRISMAWSTDELQAAKPLMVFPNYLICLSIWKCVRFYENQARKLICSH